MARKKWLRLPTLGGGALVILLIAMVLLNPSEKKQRNAIYDVTRRKAEEKSGVVGVLVGTLAKELDVLKAVPYKYNNYFVFSTITLSDDRVTFGVLGYVKVNEKFVQRDR